MATNPAILIAGEPILNLLEGLKSIEFNTTDDGTVRIVPRLEGDAGASWRRAIERYGADLITAHGADDIELRQGEAFLRIFKEITAVMKAVNPDE